MKIENQEITMNTPKTFVIPSLCVLPVSLETRFEGVKVRAVVANPVIIRDGRRLDFDAKEAIVTVSLDGKVLKKYMILDEMDKILA